MKIKKLYIAIVALALSAGMTSCNDYLDKQPDSRLDLQSPTDVSKLLVNAYPQVHPAYLLEMYSDNTDCNLNTGWDAADRFQQQAYEWADITETSAYEAPATYWSTYYDAITTANIALEHINSQKDQSSYSAQKGEALLCRAYAMFQLANVFCMAYDETTAATDLGLPYPEVVETNVHVKYDRGTLAELYAKIDKDLQEGLKLVGSTYDKPKFHFTSTSAAAFAARFYLYYQKYDKAVEYANKVLGSNAKGMLRDWNTWGALSANKQIQPNAYINSSVKANLLLQVVVSEWGVIGGPFQYGDKYAHSAIVAAKETVQSEGPWGFSDKVFNYTVFSNASLSKYIVRKVPYDFEYSDIQAGIGTPHAVYAEFTADETLLVRAEAQALLGHYAEALNDLNTELAAFSKTGVQLTLDDVKKFYSDAVTAYYTPEKPTPRKAFHTAFAIDKDTEEPMLQCILHLRRIMTIHEGLRMQDVKRYGITIYRRDVKSNYKITDITDTMEARDPRLAIQLPQDVITAGVTPNPRNK